MTRRKKKPKQPSYDYWSQLKRRVKFRLSKIERPRYRVAKRDGKWVVMQRGVVKASFSYYLSCWSWIEKQERKC